MVGRSVGTPKNRVKIGHFGSFWTGKSGLVSIDAAQGLGTLCNTKMEP